MTPEALSGLAGMLLAVALEYIPGLADKWAALDATRKRAYVLLMTIGIAALSYVFACVDFLTGLLPPGWVECSQAGWQRIVLTLLAAIVASQGTHMLTKKS